MAKNEIINNYPVITVFEIIGMIVTPIIDGVTIALVFSNNWLYFLILGLYALSIPLGILTIKRVQTAMAKKDVIALGILSLIFVSLVGGVLTLSFRYPRGIKK